MIMEYFTNDEKELFEIWDVLTDYNICTDEEIGLVTALMGRSVDTLLSILYVRTGYRSLEQFYDECDEEE